MKKILFSAALAAASIAFPSCSCEHTDEPKPEHKIGHVLCTDGEIVSLCEYVKSYKEAIGIVFWLDPKAEGDKGYAVYLYDIPPVAFSDSVGLAHNTSADILARDGNANTYSIMTTENDSPMADAVFDMWKFGQSAYIPSVAQLRLLTLNKDFISDRIVACGGDALPDEPEQCWFWTSTEVEGQEPHKAWLFSMHSGAIQETPKNQPHKVRPIITINNQ